MCTPLTYEGISHTHLFRFEDTNVNLTGLVDEVFAIKNSKIDVDEFLVNPSAQKVCIETFPLLAEAGAKVRLLDHIG